MDVKVPVPVAAQLTGLGLPILREAIASGALPATMARGEVGILPYHIHLDDLAAWCRRCGYDHLWADGQAASSAPVPPVPPTPPNPGQPGPPRC
jgi:hypothetical protein